MKFVFAAFACAALIAPFGIARAQNVAPPIPPASATAHPQATPTPIQAPGALPTPATNNATVTIGPKGNAKATPAPPKTEEDNRVGVTGVWEIAIQQPEGVVYTHFKIVQKGTALTGQYLDDKGKKFPLSGTIDGKNVRVVVALADGTALIFSGQQDAFTDMVGTLSTSKDLIGFTAAYRPKYKWIDNISPGGIGGLGNGNPQP